MEKILFALSKDLRPEGHCELPNINEASESHTAYMYHVIFETRFRSMKLSQI